MCETVHYFHVFTFVHNKKDFEEIISPKLFFSYHTKCIHYFSFQTVPNYIPWLSILKSCVHIKILLLFFFCCRSTIQIMCSYLLEIVFNLLGRRYNEYN